MRPGTMTISGFKAAKKTDNFTSEAHFTALVGSHTKHKYVHS